MKFFPNEQFRGPLRGLVFDMDNTLYTNPLYAQHQEDVLIARLAWQKGWDESLTTKKIHDYRIEEANKTGRNAPSLGNTFLSFGIPISQSIEWREREIRPELYLDKDDRLVQTLGQLVEEYALSIVTNNPTKTAVRTLEILGVDDLFSVIIGLDSLGVSKPHAPSFLKAASLMGRGPTECMTIGDRYGVDLVPGLEIGMLGLLVTGVEEVYSLPEFLKTLKIT